MKSRTFLSAFTLVLAMLACNLPSNAATETPTLTIFTPSMTQSIPTSAATQPLLPSNTPPPTSTGTPSVPSLLQKMSRSIAVWVRESAGLFSAV